MTLFNYLVYVLVVSSWLSLVYGQGADSTGAAGAMEEVVTSQNITFYIEHALGPNHTFLPRTKIQFIMKSDGRQGLKYLDKNTVTSADELSQLRELLTNNDLYTLRIRAEKEDWKGHFILSSMPAVSKSLSSPHLPSSFIKLFLHIFDSVSCRRAASKKICKSSSAPLATSLPCLTTCLRWPSPKNAIQLRYCYDSILMTYFF